MAKEYAEICWPEKPQAEFYDLTKKSQDRLSAFLEKQRVALERSGGGNQEGFAWEWEPGFAVYWDIKLKPQFRETGGRPALSTSRAKQGRHYRIEVLEIRKLS
jgi:hypothetical protein